MISLQQMQRALAEFEAASTSAVAAARRAERELERYSALSAPEYSPVVRKELFESFQEADYQAESFTWIATLIRNAIANEEGAVLG